MSEYIRLAEPPVWVIQYPQCSACMVDLFTEGDGWTCPVCGTSWPQDAGDGDEGTLYADWSGEEPEGEPLDGKQAMQAGIDYERRERRAMYARWGWCEHGLISPHPGCPGGSGPNPD